MVPDQVLMSARMQEGSLIVEAGGQSYAATAGLLVCSVPSDGGPTATDVRWMATGDFVQMASALARFLVNHPPFAQSVMGLMAIMAAGNNLTGVAVLQQPQPPPVPPWQEKTDD